MYNHSDNYVRTHGHSTHGSHNLMPAQSRLTVTSNSIHVIGPKIFNSIPIEIKTKPSLNSFKYHYKQYLLSQYTNLSA